jgi:hypothetical protein
LNFSTSKGERRSRRRRRLRNCVSIQQQREDDGIFEIEIRDYGEKVKFLFIALVLVASLL